MAVVRISEFADVARINYGSTGVDALSAPIAAQGAITIPTDISTASSAALNGGTNFVRIATTGDCLVAVDGVIFEFFPSGTIEVRKVPTSRPAIAVKAAS